MSRPMFHTGRRKIFPPFGGFAPAWGEKFFRAYSLFMRRSFCVGVLLSAEKKRVALTWTFRNCSPHLPQSSRYSPAADRGAPLPELMDRKKRDIMERKGDKEDENKRQKQQKESSAAAL